MFAQAYKVCSEFTRPVIISILRADGTCDASVASFIHINDEGWIATSAHVLQMADELKQSQAMLQAAELANAEVPAGTSALAKRRRAQSAVPIDPKWVREFAYWWAYDGSELVDVFGEPEADIVFGRLSPWNPPTKPKGYPVFKDGKQGVDCGTSLCRLGYPFASLQPSYVNGRFHIPGTVYRMPKFPIDGIFTRHVDITGFDYDFRVGFIETSSPGLKGQSGGPIFDKHGTVWGIQSRTMHFPLGFSPSVPGSNNGAVEHQFLNVGWGTHPDTLTGLMRRNGVKFSLSTY
jgi:hypothetical protein